MNLSNELRLSAIPRTFGEPQDATELRTTMVVRTAFNDLIGRLMQRYRHIDYLKLKPLGR